MTGKDQTAYILHMLQCIGVIEDCLSKGRTAFEKDMVVRGAVLRYLQEIAESSKRLAKTTKAKHAEIPWRKIAGFRNVLVHDYLGVDMDTVYLVAEMEILKLKSALLKMKKDKAG